ncbi:MAG: hypothetical protein HY324_01795, partial [Chlamydiia bacterium]|nr:hypothetical protein [Chlamydiia bacterium]
MSLAFLVYDLFLFFILPFIPKRGHHYQRLFLKAPHLHGKETIWIHAVSVGEVKAFQPLYPLLKKQFPNACFFLTCTTATGMKEAKRLYPEEVIFSYLPWDLSWIMRRFVRKISPRLLLLIEGDLWPNMLRFVHENRGKIAIVSAKLSFRSAKRYLFFRFLSKKLFSYIDLILAKSQEHYDRFLPLVQRNRLQLVGNLKWDLPPAQTTPLPFTTPPLPIVTVASTHEGEEELLLQHLPLDSLFLILAPRHPERFHQVATLLKQRKIPFFRWSELSQRRGDEQLLLMDAFVELPNCFVSSQLAIVAGSFIPGIGGHNLFEPCLYGAPVFFGPYAFSQKEL